jgi:hypothetical protein
VRQTRRAALILAVSAVIQIGLAAMPDTMADLLSYRVWTRTLAAEGLAAAYWPPDPPGFHLPVDYPPLFPYVLWAVGRAARVLSVIDDDRWLDFAIRLPSCLALLLLGALVRSEARRIAPGAEDLALGAIVLNPALLFVTAYWGQADAIVALLIAGALVSFERGAPVRSAAIVAAACFVKPLAYPFVPLVLLLAVRRFGGRRAAVAACAAAGAAALVFAPFFAIGRGADAVSALALQLEAMPYASVNAHNVWWLLTGGLPWTDAGIRVLDLVSLKQISIAVFGAFYAAVLVRALRTDDARATYTAAATVALGFFMLLTHMHENHAVPAVVMLSLAALGRPRVQGVLLAASLTLLANMALHDPFLTDVVRPYVPGPHVLAPQQPDVPEELCRYLEAEGYPWVVAQIRGETSRAGLVATFANAAANVLVFAAWLWVAYGRRGRAGAGSA